MPIYGGDEISAIVLDPGSSTLRVGWAGEDTPRGVLPTAFGYVPDEEEGQGSAGNARRRSTAAEENGAGNGTPGAGADADAMEGVEGGAEEDGGDPSDPTTLRGAAKTLARSRMAASAAWKTKIYSEKRKRYLGEMGVNGYRPGMEVASSFNEQGVLSSLPSFYAQAEYALSTTLGADTREHPLLITEPSWTTKEAREEMTEIAFEGLEAPAFYLANQTVMSAFAAGKPTALIIDIGESSMSAIPVVDGFILRKAIQRQLIGGNAVSKALLYSIKNPPPNAVRQGTTDIVAQYLVKSKSAVEPGRPSVAVLREDRLKGATESFKMHQTLRVMHEFKEACAQVLESPWNDSIASARGSKTFEFPDGYNDSFGIERFRGPEILFNPQTWQSVGDVLPAAPQESPYVGLADLAIQAINATDVDSRSTLFSNVVCVGGGSALQGLTDRLSYEMGIKAPGQKVKIHSPGNYVERRYSSWIGGSILSSLGTFHQLWISKQEWEEHGNTIVHARCK